jgi:hypothetical protein
MAPLKQVFCLVLASSVAVLGACPTHAAGVGSDVLVSMLNQHEQVDLDAGAETKPTPPRDIPRLPDRFSSKGFFLHNKFLIHSYLWADGTAKPDPIVFREDGTVENKRAGLGGEDWELVDHATLRVGKVHFRLESHQGILLGRVGEMLNSYVYLDVPGEKISTPDQATNAVARRIDKVRGGFRAEDRLEVFSNFHLGVAEHGFAEPGDRVWQVHLHSLHHLQGAAEVYWVNARSGEVRFIYPMKAD